MSAAVVLVVGVGVDDDVGAELQAGVEAGLEAGGQALVVGQPDDVVDAVLAGDLDGAVGRAVVDDEPLDGVEAVDLAREVGQRRRERLLLVEAGDLDDELHLGPVAGVCRVGRTGVPHRRRRPDGAVHSRSASIPEDRPVRHATVPAGRGPARPHPWQAHRSPARAATPAARRTAATERRPPARRRRPRAALAGARAGVARRDDGGAVRRLPDLPELRLATTRCSGAASCSTAQLPTFDAYRAPTQHPLAVAFGAAAVAAGRRRRPRLVCGDARRRFVALAAGLYRLARASFTPLVGLVAAALLCTRFDFPFLAARGYIDIPYLAFVVWAAALEAASARAAARRCCVLLAGAGLLRPEAWLLSGLYWLWLVAGHGLGRSACAAAPPRRHRPGRLDRHRLGSSPATRCSRCTTRAAWPRSSGASAGSRRSPAPTWSFLINLAKAPVVYAGMAGLRARARAGAAAPRRARWRCWPSAWRRSCSSASPACRSSTATCSCRR